jgi:hypothetical protein
MSAFRQGNTLDACLKMRRDLDTLVRELPVRVSTPMRPPPLPAVGQAVTRLSPRSESPPARGGSTACPPSCGITSEVEGVICPSSARNLLSPGKILRENCASFSAFKGNPEPQENAIRCGARGAQKGDECGVMRDCRLRCLPLY